MPEPPCHRIYQRRKPEDSLFYRVLAENIETFLTNLAEKGRSLPQHVERELCAFLKCGVLAYGFVRVKCSDCRYEHLVAFSCKKRGICSSCGAKRMAETAAHLTDNIIPRVPVRQYVLSVPIPLRYWMASNKRLTAKVHKILAESVAQFYAIDTKTSGSVAFVQRFGSALNLNVHFHMLQIEGYYSKKSTGIHKFIRRRSPSDRDIQNLLVIISTRIIKLLRRMGYLGEPQEQDTYEDPLLEENPTQAECMAASVKQRIALGQRAGQKVRFLGSGFGYEEETPTITGKLCANVNGFSLHAATRVRAHQRKRLENLIRYMARPSLSTQRMSLTPTGDIKYELKKKWRNGVTHVLLSPMELIEKLCALIPLPYFHLVRYWGVFAPNSKLRQGVIPGKTRAEIKADQKKQDVRETPAPIRQGSYARILARVFAIDISTCSLCGGEMKIIGQIHRVDVIRKILSHLGENPRPPPIAPARSRELFAG